MGSKTPTEKAKSAIRILHKRKMILEKMEDPRMGAEIFAMRFAIRAIKNQYLPEEISKESQ